MANKLPSRFDEEDETPFRFKISTTFLLAVITVTELIVRREITYSFTLWVLYGLYRLEFN